MPGLNHDWHVEFSDYLAGIRDEGTKCVTASEEAQSKLLGGHFETPEQADERELKAIWDAEAKQTERPIECRRNKRTVRRSHVKNASL